LLFASTPIIPLLASRGNFAGGQLQEMLLFFAGAGPEINASVFLKFLENHDPVFRVSWRLAQDYQYRYTLLLWLDGWSLCLFGFQFCSEELHASIPPLPP
jgi:hypothetical protein